MKITPLEKAVQICGGQSALAGKLKVTQQQVWNWLNREEQAPPLYCVPIEQATGGKVTRHQLRPDIYPDDV